MVKQLSTYRMRNLLTSESFSDDAIPIEYEVNDASDGDAAVGPHDDSDGGLDIFTRRSSKTSSTSSTSRFCFSLQSW